MPPKKIATSKATNSTQSKTVNKNKTNIKPDQKKKTVKQVNTKTTVKQSSNPSKSKSKTKASIPKKKIFSKEDLAAIKIQKTVRGFLAKRLLPKLKKQKQEYDELIEKLQKEAWLTMIENQRKEDENKRQREEEERRKKRQEIMWRKNLLDAAFDGELDEIKKILTQAEERYRKISKLEGTALEKSVERYHTNLLDCCDANENSTLSEACAGGDVETISFFLQNGAFINSLGQFHRTPLYRAAFGGHLDAVKILLNYGGDPRILDNDGVSSAEVAALPEITEMINSWDITQTDEAIEKFSEEREQKKQMEIEYRKIEEDRIKVTLEKYEKEYKNKQKLLQRAHQELNKRIAEHDSCITEGYERTDVTLKAINCAEDTLLDAQTKERACYEKLMNCRLSSREQSSPVEDEELNCVKFHIKELDEILMRDVGNKIKESKKWPLLIDSSAQAVTFLRYRDTNYLNTLNPSSMVHDAVRVALLGAIRYGKCFVLDMMEVDMLEFIKERLNEIQADLYQSLLDRSVLQSEKYIQLIRKSDGVEYSKDKFVSTRTERFMFVLITKMYNVPDEWKELFYAIRVVTPLSM